MKIEKESLFGLNSYIENGLGALVSARVDRENVIDTPYGSLVPRFSGSDYRRKDISSLTFYPSGDLKAIELEEQTAIRTPAGEIEAERLVFYPSGALKALFPSNGRIGFAWTEKDEGEMLRSHLYRFPFACFKAKAVSLRFYESGKMRSLTLWPDEMVDIATPVGNIQTKVGFTLYENGVLRSIEPLFPVEIDTPIGPVTAYNPLSHGIDASQSTLGFTRSGAIERVATAGIIKIVRITDGRTYYEVSEIFAGLSSIRLNMKAILLAFTDGRAMIGNDERFHSYSLDSHAFAAEFSLKALESLTCDEESGEEF